MKKIITVLLMLSPLVLLLLSCADEQKEIDPQMFEEETFITESEQEERMEHLAEVEVQPTPEPSPELIQITEIVEEQQATVDPQIIIRSTPIESPKSMATPTPKPSQMPTPKPVQSQTPPTLQPTPQPVQQPTPTPQTTPQPTPQPTPTPPPVVEPPPARTICNTCGADITGNVPAHGTIHLLNDENFSYRVE